MNTIQQVSSDFPPSFSIVIMASSSPNPACQRDTLTTRLAILDAVLHPLLPGSHLL